VRKHKKNSVITLDDLKRFALFFFPCFGQCKRERPVHFAPPERVQDHLLEVTPAHGIFDVFDEKMMAVRKTAAGRLFLHFQEPDELIDSRFFHGVRVHELVFEIGKINAFV
jgi:hypothetical protein